jgi:uncharacterized protein
VSCYRRVDGGIEISVRLTPRSSVDAVEGVEISGDRAYLKARVRAVPENGKANEALERLVAKWLEVPRGQVSIVTGTASRLKTLKIIGDAAALADKMASVT